MERASVVSVGPLIPPSTVITLLDQYAEPIPFTLTVRNFVPISSCVVPDSSCTDTRLSMSTWLVAECESRKPYS